jgi:phospholipase C
LYFAPRTATPVKHLVVIFQENVSFDHYFGTYPNAANTDGNPFHAKPGTPAVNGLTPALLNHNPNLFNPQRLTPSEALTCDQDHAYTPEQEAFDGGKMDKFVQFTDTSTCTGQPILFGLVISPWTRANYVSHNLTDQSSVVRFIEDNWLGGQRIGNGSYDSIAGRLDAPGGVLDFRTFPHLFPVILDPATGEVKPFFPF